MYYEALEIIKTNVLAGNIITSVTQGPFEDIDTKRQTLFSLCHVVPASFLVNQKTVVYSFTLYFCDLVDFNKEDPRDQQEAYWTNDNMIDVFHQMSLAAQLFIDRMNRGEAYENNIRINVPSSGSFFSNKVENLVSGVQLSVSIEMPNTSVTDGIC